MAKAREEKTMSHLLETCDVVDVLEEAVTLKRPVVVELKGGRRFVDKVRDVVTRDGQEWATFALEGTLPLSDIRFCAPAEHPEPTYAGKRLSHHEEPKPDPGAGES
jgi:transcriptional antiterminator Rof (Rho-off)